MSDQRPWRDRYFRAGSLVLIFLATLILIFDGCGIIYEKNRIIHRIQSRIATASSASRGERGPARAQYRKTEGIAATVPRDRQDANLLRSVGHQLHLP
jgi:hypothetical protein